MILPSEHSTRRPDFAGGVPIILADSSFWWVPIPTAVPDPDHHGAYLWSVDGQPDRGFDAEYLAACEAVPDPDDPDPSLLVDLHDGGRPLVVLLRRNYHITEADAYWLTRLGWIARGDFLAYAQVARTAQEIHTRAAASLAAAAAIPAIP